MTTAIIMGVLGGLLCTQFFNIFFIHRLIKGIYLYFLKVTKKKEVKKCFEFELDKTCHFIVTQVLSFAVGTILLTCWYYFAAADRTFLEFIATGWIIGIIHIINLIHLDEKHVFDTWDMPDLFGSSGIIFGLGIFCISIILNISTPIYNYFNHQEITISYIQDSEVPVITTDVLNTLETEKILEGYTLKDPINRSGKIIIPMKRSDNVSIEGYIVIEDEQPTIVFKTLRYTPYNNDSNSPSLVARNYLPQKIFFGTWSFQLSPDGDVYFAKMYGKHTFLRAGREIEGLVLVNAETGEVITYSLDKLLSNEAPTWISGISE